MKGKDVYCAVRAEVNEVQEVGWVTHKHHVINITQAQAFTTCDRSGKQDWLSSWQYGVRIPCTVLDKILRQTSAQTQES